MVAIPQYVEPKQKMPRPEKANRIKISITFLKGREKYAHSYGSPTPKWVEFSQTLIAQGYELSLYEARETVSKYITVMKNGKKFKVRFSNHKPSLHQELKGDCDFIVGYGHFKITTTVDALIAVNKYFSEAQDGKNTTA